MDESGGVHL